jgi:hypothetical protein
MRDTIDMALEASCFPFEDGYTLVHIDKLKAFEALVRADEREACAKVLEAHPSYDWNRSVCEAVAAIRARGNT